MTNSTATAASCAPVRTLTPWAFRNPDTQPHEHLYQHGDGYVHSDAHIHADILSHVVQYADFYRHPDRDADRNSGASAVAHLPPNGSSALIARQTGSLISVGGTLNSLGICCA